jgi:hypothetical protein
MVYTILYKDNYVEDITESRTYFCGVFETEKQVNEWINTLCDYTAVNFTCLLNNKSRSPIRTNFVILNSYLNNKVFQDMNNSSILEKVPCG